MPGRHSAHGRRARGSRLPRQRGAHAHRARGSRLPRLAGLTAVVLAAACGTTAYLVSAQPAVPPRAASVPRAARLPGKVLAAHQVGLVVAVPPRPGRSATPQMLAASRTGLMFRPVPPASLGTGSPVWTADQLAGPTYIFVYRPTGQCLGLARSGHAAGLALQRCDLGLGQRWRPVRPAVTVAGLSYQQYGNVSSGQCLSVGTARPAAGPGADAADLARCRPGRSWRQLVSFWWGS